MQIEDRIEKLDKEVFFILSTARCRSSWFANFFTYKDSFCYNEESRYIADWDQLVDRIESRPEKYVGFEDPELLHYVETLYRLFPKAKYLLLERNREDSERSFIKMFQVGEKYTRRKFTRWYLDIQKFKNIIPEYKTVDFELMDSEPFIKTVWNYILPDVSFDVDRWNLLTELPISQTLSKRLTGHIDNSLGPFADLDKMDKIGTDNYIFNCHEKVEIKDDNGNGGDEAKDKFNEDSSSSIVYIPTHNYDKLTDDILLIDFLTPSMCDSIIELSELHGGYKSNEGDDVPGQEIRLHEIGLSEKLAFHWEKCVAPILHEEFHPCNYYGIRDAFIIKYTMKGQRDLRLHSDLSLVTGSVKLNDDYTGGDLYFPRQKFSNKDVPVGKCILFPGQVTHSHTSKELESGTKFSLTIWTKRGKNDG